jgi:hypothetical protein
MRLLKWIHLAAADYCTHQPSYRLLTHRQRHHRWNHRCRHPDQVRHRCCCWHHFAEYTLQSPLFLERIGALFDSAAFFAYTLPFPLHERQPPPFPPPPLLPPSLPPATMPLESHLQTTLRSLALASSREMQIKIDSHTFCLRHFDINRTVDFVLGRVTVQRRATNINCGDGGGIFAGDDI